MRLLSLHIDRVSMETTELRNYYDRDAIRSSFGDDARDRYFDETDGMGAIHRRDGRFWHRNRHTNEVEEVSPDAATEFLGRESRWGDLPDSEVKV